MNNMDDIIPGEPEKFKTLAKQLAAVQKNGRTIQLINNHSEQVQIAAVQQDGWAIFDILAKGIIPSIPVQKAAVLQNPIDALYSMISYNIPISKMIQWTAAKQSKEFGQIIDKDTLNHLDPDVQKYLKDDKS